MNVSRQHTDQHHSDATPHESAITHEDVEHTRRYIVTEGGRAYPLDTRKAIDAYRESGKEPNVVPTDWTDLDARIEVTRGRSTYLCTVTGCGEHTRRPGRCERCIGLRATLPIGRGPELNTKKPIPWSTVLWFCAAMVGVVAALVFLAGGKS